MSPITDENEQVPVRRKLPRLVGEARTDRARELATSYDAERATIRALAAKHDMSYCTVRRLLLEAEVKLRPRGGRAARSGGGDPR